MCFAFDISEFTRQLYKSFVRFGKGSKTEYVKTLALRLAMPIMIIMLIMLIMVVRGVLGKEMGGEAPQFSCQLRAIIGPCDHVMTGSLKAKMVCRIRTKTLGVKHGDGVIG